MPADLLTTAEAADRLNCTTTTIRNYVRAGRLAVAQKLPTSTGTYLFRCEDVEALREQPDQQAS